MPVVAGVDSSTQSTTVVLHDANTGQFLGSGKAPHSPTFPPVSEQQPQEWWNALGIALSKAKRSAGVESADITGISVAAQCHGLVPLDAGGAVIRPAKLWNDTTSAAQAAHLRAIRGAAGWAASVGSVPPPAFTISKLLWLRENEPDHFGLMTRVALPHDWLTLQLSGEFVSDRSDASGTGYFSAATDRYDFDALDLVDPRRDWSTMVPAVRQPAEPAGRIRPRAAEELGIAPSAVVGPGAGDQHAGAVGLGVTEGDLVFVFGTSGVVYGLSPREVIDTSGLLNSVADATGGFQPLWCSQNAAKVTDTFARLLGVDHEGLTALALDAERHADRPVLAAFLDGERTPDLPDARGVLSGLTSSTSREDVALSAFEGVVLGLDRGRRLLERLGVATGKRVIATGGGAASEAYLRVLADVTGRPIETVTAREPVATGAAIQVVAAISGRSVAEVRDDWAPRSSVVAEPLTPVSQEVFDEYARVAAWEGSKQ